MKLILALVLVFTFSTALADEIKVEINPSKPVAGEIFQAFFRIFTSADDEPNITFSPSAGVEIVSKANQGVSTRTVYANGKLTVTREVSITYDLMASRTGTAFLRDIKVGLGAKTISHPVIAINVLKEAEVVPDIFVMSDVPKKTLYIGEGVTVRYYLYSKVPVNSVDIKRYPKLNKFLKRFLQEPERSERVSVDGEIYLRTQIYAAKLFPEKPGELKIDPLYLSATYASIRAGDPFGAFGMNRNYRTKTVKSEVVKIQVLPLPLPVPANFTGLIGNHDIQLQFAQTKLIVNEPLEVKLTVSGSGALENLEAPNFLKNKALEEFESNGDLKILNANEATKTFDYTFLAKENIKLPEKTLILSYFDPNIEKYVPVNLQIPEIEIAGGRATSTNSSESFHDEPKPIKTKNIQSSNVADISGPILQAGKNFRSWIPFFNASLAGLSIILAVGWFIKKNRYNPKKFKGQVPSRFKKGDFSLSEFSKWISPLVQKTGKSPVAIIKDSALEDETKTYFIDLLSSNDYKDYSFRKSQIEFKYHSGHFKKLGRYIESVTNESFSQSS